jgi:hypothetical protein
MRFSLGGAASRAVALNDGAGVAVRKRPEHADGNGGTGPLMRGQARELRVRPPGTQTPGDAQTPADAPAGLP